MTHRQHQHPHLHADNYIAWHQHHAPNGPVMSRRSFLQGSAAALAGALTVKIDRLFGTSLAAVQTDQISIFDKVSNIFYYVKNLTNLTEMRQFVAVDQHEYQVFDGRYPVVPRYHQPLSKPCKLSCIIRCASLKRGVAKL